jgi:hypothetical protein
MHPKSSSRAELKLNSVGHSLSHVATVLKENAVDILGNLDGDNDDGDEQSERSATMRKVGQQYNFWADKLLETNGDSQTEH